MNGKMGKNRGEGAAPILSRHWHTHFPPIALSQGCTLPDIVV